MSEMFIIESDGEFRNKKADKNFDYCADVGRFFWADKLCKLRVC